MRTGRADVLVIGGASLDTVAHLAHGERGDAPSVSHSYPSIGGTGAGKAMSLAALGMSATLHAVLGTDRAGDAVAARLPEAGVRLLVHRGERDTQRHANLMLPGGERLSLPVEPPERPASFDPDALAEAMAAADVIVPNILDYVRPCLAPARRTGKPLWIDIHDCDGHASHHVEFIDAADVLFVSAERLTEPDAFMARMIAAGRRLVVCTQGAAGSIALTADGLRVERSAAPGIAVEDTDGAGDAYVAGFLLGRPEGRPLAECMGYGTAAAGSCIAHRGLVAPDLDAARVRAAAAVLPPAREG